jgi:hypothetical protein
MPNLSKFRALTNREQAVVALAVLLDGHDSVEMLVSDRDRGVALSRAAEDLVVLSPDLRMPLMGTLLRRALEEIDT